MLTYFVEILPFQLTVYVTFIIHTEMDARNQSLITFPYVCLICNACQTFVKVWFTYCLSEFVGVWEVFGYFFCTTVYHRVVCCEFVC